jgi:hypothetical protein
MGAGELPCLHDVASLCPQATLNETKYERDDEKYCTSLSRPRCATTLLISVVNKEESLPERD